MWLVLLAACTSTPHASVTLAEAATASADALTIRGGEVRVDMMTGWSPPCAEGRTCRSVFVAPLVAGDWSADAPVTAWLTCKPVLQKPNECLIAFKQATTFGGPVRARVGSGSTSWNAAVDRVHATYGVRSADGAPVVELDFLPTISG